jgi:hypothetical protein
VTVENLPALRAVFKRIKDLMDTHPAELSPVIEVEAQVINMAAVAPSGAKPAKKAQAAKPATGKGGKVTESQRKMLMALAGELGWSREDRMAFAAELLAVEVESWSDLSEFQAAQLLGHMQALADDRRALGDDDA